VRVLHQLTSPGRVDGGRCHRCDLEPEVALRSWFSPGRMPAAMIFSPSIGGVSHAREEDTSEDDLRVAIEAYANANHVPVKGLAGARLEE